jgi:hypothetical protein
MRLSLLVAAAVWLMGVEAFVVPSPTPRVARIISPSRLMASREEIRQEALRAYRIKRGLLEVPDAPVGVVPDLPPVVPDTPPVVVDVAPKIVDSVPNIMDISSPPATLLDVTATPRVVDVEGVPRVGLEDGVDPISTFWRQLTETVKTATPQVKVEVKMPDFSAVQMPDIKQVKLPNVNFPNVKLPEIPAREFGQGITFPGSDERIPTLLDFLKGSSSGVVPIRPEPFDTLGIQNSIETIKANLADLAGWKGMLDTLKIGEYGAWYLAGSLLLAWQIQTKSQKGSFEKELKIAETKAKQAAEAATLAAQGATKAKQLATTTTKTTTTTSSAETILAQSKLHQMQLEKETMKKELEYLRQQTEELQKQLAKATKTENVNGQVETPTIEKKVEVMPQDPDQDKRILDIIKEKDMKNVKAPGKKAPATIKKAPAPRKEKTPDRLLNVLREAKATTTATTMAAPETETETTTATAPETAPETATAMAAPETETETTTATAPETAPAPKKAAPKKAGAPKAKAAIKKTAKKEEVNVIMAAQQPKVSKPINETAFFVSTVERERKSAEKPAPPKAVVVEVEKTLAPKAEETKSDNPWSSLSESTLKRKTVKELTAYLSERGIETTNELGKPKSKQDLVKAVLTL